MNATGINLSQTIHFVCASTVDNLLVAGDPQQFHYLNQGMSPVVESIDDAEDFASVRQALALLGEFSC